MHLKPQGEITIINFLNKQVGKTFVNNQGVNVLPQSIRKFVSKWLISKSIVLPGKGFFTELKNEKNNFALGKYKAELKLVNYEGGVKTIWIFHGDYY